MQEWNWKVWLISATERLII